jgi:glycosyltransferase involved in cell wall biosynthesis
MTRLRVAHVGSLRSESANGVHATISGLARELPNHGIDVEVWHFSRRVDRPAERVDGGVTVVDLPKFGRRGVDALRLPRYTGRYVRERARSVDLMHLHSVYQGENIAIARLGIPYVLTPNGGYHRLVRMGRNFPAKAAWEFMWEDSYRRRAKALHAVSSAEAADLAELVPGQTITVVPNALGGEWLDLAPRTGPVHGPWLFLGRLALEHKGLDLLLEGYAEARSDTALPPLVLAGPDFRGDAARLRARIGELDLGRAVRVVPPAFGPEKLALLRSAAAFLLMSRWEGLPFAALEAMAAGCPVAVTEATNVADVVHRYGAGIVVEGTSAGVAQGLRLLAGKSPQWRQRAGASGQAAVRAEYRWAASAARVAALYRSIAC